MSERSSGLGSLLGNPSILLALVTIGGGWWLVSHRLTSGRPVNPAGTASSSIVGDQALQARLWEDPFKEVASGGAPGDAGGSGIDIDLRGVRAQMEARFQAAGILLLPVMIAGGQYGEDQESRIRSRHAIVSALGRAGYAPENAEHIGELRLPWLSKRQLDEARRLAKKPGWRLAQLWEHGAGSDPKPRLIGNDAPEGELRVRFEWYRPKVFFERASEFTGRRPVLVLWLADTDFEDDPLLRLPLLLEDLTDPFDVDGAPAPMRPRVALVGPRRSSDLRALVGGWQLPASVERAPDPLDDLARVVRANIDIFCASASSMDEVLVKDPAPTPRASVADRLRGKGFRSFRNFAAVDSQLADEILGELALRGVDLGNAKHHVVLISEWDTFYARMLSLTYGAAVAMRTGQAASRADYVTNFALAANPPTAAARRGFFAPQNFHSYVYLRGLDGQTLGNSGDGKDGDGAGNSRRYAPTSVEELRGWVPDINKAEGQAQFDYLGRLGDTVAGLRARLRREGRGEIKAVGMVGSDVYDTLLLLQALRERFPDVWFFTTEFDVRFLHPREREWARNLIVASGYGLELHPDLQAAVPPFRDSTQTAQFVAVLAALEHATLKDLAEIPPRRFEIGNREAVDLTPPRRAPGNRAAPGATLSAASLHPGSRWDHDGGPTRDAVVRLWSSAVAAALLIIGAIFWGPLRRFTREAWSHPAKALDYSDHDVGGPYGAEALLLRLGEVRDAHDAKVAGWLLDDGVVDRVRSHLRLEAAPVRRPDAYVDVPASAAILASAAAKAPAAISAGAKTLVLTRRARARDASEAPGIAATLDTEAALDELERVFVVRLNRLLERDDETPARETDLHAVRHALGDGNGGVAYPKSARLPVLTLSSGCARMLERYDRRRAIDQFLDRVASPARPAGHPMATMDTLAAVEADHGGLARWIDAMIGKRGSERKSFEYGKSAFLDSALQSAAGARDAALRIFRLRCRMLFWFWIGVVIFGALAAWLGWTIIADSFIREDGEPFSLTSGTSAWPAQIIRMLVLILAVSSCFGLSYRLRGAALRLTRQFRFSFEPLQRPASTDHVCAEALWHEYRESNRFRKRARTIFGMLAGYVVFVIAITVAIGQTNFAPARGATAQAWNAGVLAGAVLAFLFLAFLMMDAALRCRDFIKKLSGGPTRYPEATRRHFSIQMGRIDDRYLDEWIDLQLIAELTETVGRSVYYPAGLLLLLLLARNSWWDAWTWPVNLVVVFGLNFVLALASVVILQRAARHAKRMAEESLGAKVRALRARVSPSADENNAEQAEKLLEEIRHLDRGAFVPFWENPVVGALFVSSGGTTLLQMAIWFVGR